MAKRKVKTIVVHAKLWFDKKYGNTYHSVVVFYQLGRSCIVHILEAKFEYGYGQHYLSTARDLLIKEGVIAPCMHSSGLRESLGFYCERNKIFFVHSSANVARRKDLI